MNWTRVRRTQRSIAFSVRMAMRHRPHRQLWLPFPTTSYIGQ